MTHKSIKKSIKLKMNDKVHPPSNKQTKQNKNLGNLLMTSHTQPQPQQQ